MPGVECKWENIGLHHPNPKVFLEPQAVGASLAYVVYRQLVAFYFGFHVVLLAAASCYTGSLKWLVFFTMWSLVVLTVNVVAQAVAVTMHYHCPEGRIEEDLSPQLKILCRFIWVAQNLTMAPSFIVTVVFWLYVYPYLPPLPAIAVVFSVSIHGVNCLYVVCDQMVTGIPVRIVHFYQPFLLAVVYAVFAGGYWAAGNGNIYDFLDFDKHPDKVAVWWCGLLSCGIALHIFMYGLYRFRLFVYASCAHGQVQPMVDDVEIMTSHDVLF